MSNRRETRRSCIPLRPLVELDLRPAVLTAEPNSPRVVELVDDILPIRASSRQVAGVIPVRLCVGRARQSCGCHQRGDNRRLTGRQWLQGRESTLDFATIGGASNDLQRSWRLPAPLQSSCPSTRAADQGK